MGCAVPFADRVKAERLHVTSSEVGIPQVGDARAPEPAKPFWLVSVSTVDPDWPGAGTVMVVGFAVTVNVGPTTVRVALPGVVADK